MVNLAIDVDDVLFPYVDTLRSYFHAQHGIPLETMPEPDSWNIDEAWGLDFDALWKMAHQGVEDGILLNPAPYPGAVDSVNRLHSEGHHIHIVTARVGGSPGLIEGQTVEWLRKCGFQFDSITFAHDKSTVRCQWGIDDRPKNLESYRETGAMPILMNRPWNQSAGPDFWRVNDMTQFAEIVSPTRENVLYG